MSRRLVIDCQILQTPAFDRGMGKYTLSLLRAFNQQQKKYQKLEILLNLNLTVDKKRVDYIKDFTGIDHVILLDLPTDIVSDFRQKHSVATDKVTEYIDTLLQDGEEIDFLITSLFFIGFPTVFPAQEEVGKYAVAYDIIPQLIWHHLRIFPDDLYYYHFRLFLEADRIFTISHAVKTDLVKLVGLESEKITPIDGGPFKKVSSKHQEKIKLKKPFIIYPSAPIVHKNNERAIRAFNRFNKTHGRGQYTLYITSTFGDDVRQKLGKISNKVEFTGNISDQALAYAYTQADALFFPSLAEGLGMPVLEALQYGLPVACSNIPVLTELSKDAFYQFDPTDEIDMAKALGQAVEEKNTHIRKKAAANTVAKYTWERSALLLADGLNLKRTSHQKFDSIQIEMPKPSISSPAAIFGELVYAKISSEFTKVGLKFTTHPRRAKRPSYVAELSEHKINGPRLRILTGKIPASPKKWKVNLALSLENGKKRKLTIYAKKITTNQMLQLKGWQFSDSKGLPLMPQAIINTLLEDLK